MSSANVDGIVPDDSREEQYSEYWDRCWNEEDPEALSVWLDTWNNFAGDEVGIFREYGVNSICDAACGFGSHTLSFASNGFEVSAFDVSKRAVELTTTALKKYGYNNCDVKVASITDTGYEDGIFDAVTAYAVLDHLTGADAKRALAELLRITKIGGLLLFSFDTASEEDFQMPHELLPDGSMLYKEGTAQEGMIFRPHDEDMITEFVAGLEVVRRWINRKGDHIVVVRKPLC